MEELTKTVLSRCSLCGAIYIDSHTCSMGYKPQSRTESVEDQLERIERKIDKLIKEIVAWKSLE